MRQASTPQTLHQNLSRFPSATVTALKAAAQIGLASRSTIVAAPADADRNITGLSAHTSCSSAPSFNTVQHACQPAPLMSDSFLSLPSSTARHSWCLQRGLSSSQLMKQTIHQRPLHHNYSTGSMSKITTRRRTGKSLRREAMRDPIYQARQAVYRSVSLPELIKAMQAPACKASKAALLQAILQTPRAVHLPLSVSDELRLFPVLDKMTQGLARHLDEMDLQEVMKVLGVCRLLRFVPQDLLDGIGQRLMLRQGNFNTDKAEPNTLVQLLHSVIATAASGAKLAALLGDACVRQAGDMAPEDLAAAALSLASVANVTAPIFPVQGTASRMDPDSAFGVRSGGAEGQGPNSLLHPRSSPATPGLQGWQMRLQTAICSGAGSKLREFGPKELSMLAYAISRLPRTASASALSRQLPHAAMSLLPHFSGRQLVSIAQSCASLGMQEQKLAFALAKEATARLPGTASGNRILEDASGEFGAAAAPVWGRTSSSQNGEPHVLSPGELSKLVSFVEAIAHRASDIKLLATLKAVNTGQ